MKLKHTLLASLMSGVLAVTGQSAQAMDLIHTYQLALDRDPTLRAARAARDARLEVVPQARALLLPNIGLSASETRTHEELVSKGTSIIPTRTSTYNTERYSIDLTQPLFNYERFVTLAQADSQAAQAQADYLVAEQDLIVRVAEAYFNVLAAQDNLRFAKSELDAIGRQLDQAKERFDVGLIAITDVHEAQARYDLAVSQKIDAEDQLDSARDALREITGPLNEPVNPLTGELDLRRPTPEDVKAWVDQALEGNLNLVSLQAAVESAHQEIKRQRAGHFPTLDLVASHGKTDIGGGSFGGRETTDSAIGIQAQLPLFQGGLVNSQTRQARYRFTEAQENLDQARRQTERQTRDAYRGVVSGIAQVKALEQALTSTETALEAAETGFEVGTRTIVDVLNAQRERFRAERDLYRSRYDYLLSILRLQQAIGNLDPSDLKDINHWFQ